jgi:FAD/FMN-containing dehydrogenase
VNVDTSVVAEALASALGPERVSVEPRDLAAASRDESDLPPVAPACVCRPASAADVAAVVRVAFDNRVPVTARGGGSSLEGSSIPAPGAIVVDFAAMDRVIEVSTEDRLAVVQPGVVFDRLNASLRPTGLFFPPSPGGSGDVATIGGMVSTDASGLYALRYGGTRRWVLGLEVVTGRGEVLRLGGRVPKSSSGYGLRDLVVGSEGTLALVTEVTLGIAPVPAASARVALAFDDLAGACETAAEAAAFVPELAAVELVDRDTLDALRRLPGFGDVPACHALFAETHGRPGECEAGLDAVRAVARERGGREVAAGADPWDLRHRVTRTVRESAGTAGVARTDCAVPLTRLAAFVAEVSSAAAGRRTHVFGHVGLGIVHCLMPLGGPAAWTREDACAMKARLAALAVAMGGVVSGEHGIGLAMRGALRDAGPAQVELMRAVKAAFDPAGILNPDKILGQR